MAEFFDTIMGWLHAFNQMLADVLNWFLYLILAAVFELLYWLGQLMTSFVLTMMDVCGCKNTIELSWNALPSNALAILDRLDIVGIIGFLLCAYALRFTIRMAWR